MPRRRVQALENILRLRSLQEQAAELALSRAATALASELELEAQEQSRQTSTEEAWSRSMVGAFDPALARAWSSKVIEGTSRLRAAAASVSKALSAKDGAAQSLQIAQARSEAADILFQGERRGERRAAESRFLAEVSDRTMGGSPHED